MTLVPAWLAERFPSVAEVQERLQAIFPEGTDRRNWLTNANAARTVFVMLYVLAVEGNDRFITPKVVVEMSNRQAARRSLRERTSYLERILRPGESADGQAWLAPNSREGIRDEALRTLKGVGAVIERELPPTSGQPRYALAKDFADLFDPDLAETERATRFDEWRRRHLTAAELARVAIRAAQAFDRVTLPDGTTHPIAPGPSAPIMIGVIERFAPRFLVDPVVLSYSDPAAPMSYIDRELMHRLGLEYEAGDPLPDILLADIADPLRFVFVEAVATEGPVDPRRVQAIARWLERSDFTLEDAYFVSAYFDRGERAFRRTVGEIAWKTAVWFVTEPDRLLIAADGSEIESLRDIPGW